MASTLPNMIYYSPISSNRMNKISNVKLLPLSRTRNRTFCNNVKAMAGSEASLKRAKQQQQYQAKGQQVSPKVLLKFPVPRTIQQMMDTMERIVEDPMVNSNTSPLIVSGNDEYSKGKIPWAIMEGQKDYRMRFNMPGMNKNDVKVWIEEKMLVVKAEKVLTENPEGQAHDKEESNSEDENWPAESHGRYNHRITLPQNVDFEKIKAQVKDGVLYITIPKINTYARIIDINVQ